jgi:hypothetical protein
MTYVSDKRIYVNRELTDIVPEDHPDGALLLVPEGGTLTDEDAARWGLSGKDPGDGQPKPSPEQAFGNAQGARSTADATKAVKGSRNKAQAAPDATKAESGPVSGADAPEPDVQMIPKTDDTPAT